MNKITVLTLAEESFDQVVTRVSSTLERHPADVKSFLEEAGFQVLHQAVKDKAFASKATLGILVDERDRAAEDARRFSESLTTAEQTIDKLQDRVNELTEQLNANQTAKAETAKEKVASK